MEVIAYDRLVLDFEALECVRARRQERKGGGTEKEPPDPDHTDDNSGAIAAEAAAERYLSATSTGEQTRESVSACWRALSEHPHFSKLTAPEKLQMINHRPWKAVAIHLMVEDCHRRFKDELVEELIQLLETHLGKRPEEDT